MVRACALVGDWEPMQLKVRSGIYLLLLAQLVAEGES